MNATTNPLWAAAILLASLVACPLAGASVDDPLVQADPHMCPPVQVDDLQPSIHRECLPSGVVTGVPPEGDGLADGA